MTNQPTPTPPPDHGTPANPIHVRLSGDQVITIQRTSKPIKAWILIAALLMLLGALLATLDITIHFAHPDRMGSFLIAGATVFAIGFAVLIAARFMAWWKHG